MARRAAVVARQRGIDPDLLLVSAGDFYDKAGILEMYQSRFLAESMVRMGYTAVAVGERELGYGLRALQADAEAGLPVICANLYRDGVRPFPPYVTRRVRGVTVGIFALLGEQPAEPGDLEVRDVADEGIRVLRELEQSGCDIVVLLAHMGREKLTRVLPRLPGVDLVIRGHAAPRVQAADECADTLGSSFEGIGVPVLFSGVWGRAIGRVVVAASHGAVAVVDSSVIHLDGSVGEDDETVLMLKKFHDEQGIRRRELQLSEFVIRDEVTGKIKERYLGLNVCRRCHNDLMPRYVLSRHFRAFEPLYQQGEDENPACLACHTTGYGEFSGYDPVKEKKGDIYLRGVQCEACHGQGTMHSRDGRYTQAAKDSCRRCHTPRWSPDFDFDTYWARAGHHVPADSARLRGTVEAGTRR